MTKEPTTDEEQKSDPGKDASKPKKAREIPGNLPYLTASGTLKKVLDKLIEAQRPEKFNHDFLENVLKVTGGAARATIPIMKRMGFLTSDGTPTDIYSKFKTDSGRPMAALQALRNGYVEIFKRSEYAYKVSDEKIRDIVVEITGLEKNDAVTRAIKGTYNVVRGFIPPDFEENQTPVDTGSTTENETTEENDLLLNQNNQMGRMHLAYNINIVLPETSDLNVLNAIFKSLKENLLK